MLEKEALLLQLAESMWETTSLEDKVTDRNFKRLEFVDLYGNACSLQESSLATANAVWFGANELDLQHFKAGQGWKKVEFPENTLEEHYVSNTRMHLSQDMVRALLPSLIRFAIGGDLR